MRTAKIGMAALALLAAGCGGKSGTPEGVAAGDDNAGMMISNEAVMSDDLAAPAVAADNAGVTAREDGAQNGVQ